jgi:uncharacterized membrane protein YtjA (UPF0391 family)
MRLAPALSALRRRRGLTTDATPDPHLQRPNAYPGGAKRQGRCSKPSRRCDLRDAAAHKESEMLHYAVVFLVIALIAAVLGFGGIAAGAAGIAKILFIVFVILAVATFLFGRNRGR